MTFKTRWVSDYEPCIVIPDGKTKEEFIQDTRTELSNKGWISIDEDGMKPTMIVKSTNPRDPSNYNVSEGHIGKGMW